MPLALPDRGRLNIRSRVAAGGGLWQPTDIASLLAWGAPRAGANRLLQTEDFEDSAWIYTGSSQVFGVEGPLGDNDAVRVSVVTPQVAIQNYAPVFQAGTEDTVSCWARVVPGSSGGFWLGINDGVDQSISALITSTEWAQIPGVTRTLDASATRSRFQLTIQSATGVELWHPQLEAGAAATPYLPNVADAAGIVSQWDDASGNGNHATQGTAANKPIVQAAVLDGKSGVVFDEVDDLLTVSGLIAQGQPTEHWFVVVLPGTIPASGVLVDSTVSPVYCRATPTSGGRSELYAGSTIASTTSLSTGTPYALGFYLNGASSSVYVNSGSAEGTGDAGAGIWNAYQIGNSGGLTIVEHLVFSTALGANRTPLLTWLGRRYPSIGI